MLLFALAMGVAPFPNVWNMGGGQAWMRPPTSITQQYKWWDVPKPSAKAAQEAAAVEVAILQERARQGDVTAMRTIGFLTLHGYIESLNPSADAMGWFYEGALRSDTVSMFVLGCAFEFGVGVVQDPKLAAYWHTRASDGGAPKTCM